LVVRALSDESSLPRREAHETFLPTPSAVSVTPEPSIER
jgi:hypothetical protein